MRSIVPASNETKFGAVTSSFTPGRWLATTTIDVELRTVRSQSDPVRANSAFALYAGTAETKARIRLINTDALTVQSTAFARI